MKSPAATLGSGPRPSLVRLLRLLLALLISAGWIASVAAHGPKILLRSDPPDGVVMQSSPARVVAWFDTELDTGPSQLQVFDTGGRQVDNGDGGVDLNDPDHASLSVSLSPLPDGVYTVRWRAAVFEDNDIVEGEFTFTVGMAHKTTAGRLVGGEFRH